MPRGMPISLSTRDRAVLILRHVEADHLLLVAEQERRDRLRQLGLADAGRSEEQQHAVGPIETVLERPLVQHQPPRDRVDRAALPDHPLAEPLLEVAEAVGHVAEHHVFGNASRPSR